MTLSAYPRPVTRIHQIELTSECNLRCKYCPHPKMQREKAHMSMETYERALKHVEYYYETGSEQTELSLTGVGEPLMHPEFITMVRMAREVLPEATLLFSTNGILLTEEIAEVLEELKVGVFLSLHRPERATHAAHIANKYHILAGLHNNFVDKSFDWAGQVDWPVTAPTIGCSYLMYGWAIILQDGTVTTCCMDAEGFNAVGKVTDPLGILALRPFDLCESCHMIVPVSIEVNFEEAV